MSNLFLSLVATLFFFGVFVLMLHFGRGKILSQLFGINGFLILCMICMVRMCLPFDFGLQKAIRCKGIFSDFFEFFQLQEHTVGAWTFTVSDICLFVWIAGAIVMLIRLFVQYRKFIRTITPQLKPSDAYDNLWMKICKNGRKDCARIPVLVGKAVEVPMSMGVFRPQILLPVRKYTQEEAGFILQHEYTHIVHKDIALKWFCQIFCCIFWWNPFVYLLRRELERALEYRCDRVVTEKMDGTQVAAYLRTIKNVLEDLEGGQPNKIGLPFAERLDKNLMVERFQLIAAGYHVSRAGRVMRRCFWMLVCLIVIGSYSIAVFPAYDPPQSEIVESTDAYEITPGNSYLEQKENGEYYLVAPPNLIAVSNETAEMMKEWGYECR